MAWLASVLFMILLWPLTSLLAGTIVSQIWDWFVVPALHAPHLSVHYAVGLSMMVGVFMSGTITSIKSQSSDDLTHAWGRYIGSIISLAISFFFAWTWHALGWYM